MIGDLFGIHLNSPDAFLGLAAKSWVKDGVGTSEGLALDHVLSIAQRNEELAARLANMPFLETFEESDNAILDTFRDLSRAEMEEVLTDPLVVGVLADGQRGSASLLRD